MAKIRSDLHTGQC